MKAAEVLTRIGQALGGEIDERKIVDAVIDGGMELTRARIGRFVPAGSLSPGHAHDGGSGTGPEASELLVPVRSRSGEALGALFFGSPAAGFFTAREEGVIAALASQAAIALDNSRLVAALEKQRAQAEEASRHYRFLAESMPQLVWTADADGIVDYVNERWVLYTGRGADGLTGDGWKEVIHPEDVDRTAETWSKALEGGTPFDITYRLRRGDGAYRWHLARAYSLCSETRRVLKWFGTATDIHDQKQFEDSQRLLSESSRVLAASFNLQSTLGTVAALVATWFRGFCVIDLLEDDRLNRVATAHSDPDRQPLMDALREFPPGKDRRSPLWRAIISRQTEVRNTITDDVINEAAQSRRHAEIRRSLDTRASLITPLLAGGIAYGTLMIGRTADEPFEPDDVRPVEELAYRIALSVSNARAYEQARDANRLKDEFLAVVSHELRTPLNAMRGWLSLLKSARLSDEQAAHARDIIERNIIAQTQLVEDLLDISRIVSGRMRLHVKPLALEPIIAAAIDSLRIAAEAKGIDIGADLPEPVGQITGDPDRLQQIVWNLLSNAIKFTPRGGRVRVSLHRTESHVDLTVTDTGQGISPDFLPHVFERFRQGDSTTTRPIGGLGLGLAIVQHLAELHGGTVNAESEGDGHGATFTLSLPALLPIGTA
jgi:PAS domain S-box-containing protein